MYRDMHVPESRERESLPAADYYLTRYGVKAVVHGVSLSVNLG